MEPILITAILIIGAYKILQLFVCRRERLNIIEKMREVDAATDVSTGADLKLDGLLKSLPSGRYAALRWGSLAVGIGMGLFVYALLMYLAPENRMLWNIESSLCGGLVLLFGGLGLLIAFIFEQKMRSREE